MHRCSAQTRVQALLAAALVSIAPSTRCTCSPLAKSGVVGFGVSLLVTSLAPATVVVAFETIGN